MHNPLHLKPEDWDILINILKQYPCDFYAYGSRIKGKHAEYSDIDICYIGEINLGDVKETFRESNLSVKVDIQNLLTLNHNFKKLIQHNLTLIHKGLKK
jgi:predicted nucleotidyltransferase